MKNKKFLIAGAFLSVILLAGCVTKSSNFEIPPPTVDLKSNPTVKISTVGDAPILSILAKDFENSFKENGGKVVDSNPDYWLVIYGVQQTRVDTPADNRHNIIFGKVRKENEYGGEELLVSRKFSTSANAQFISVIFYDVKTLAPMVNFDFPYYSSSIVDGNKKTTLRSNKNVSDFFVAKMNEILFKKSAPATNANAPQAQGNTAAVGVKVPDPAGTASAPSSDSPQNGGMISLPKLNLGL